jgi:hypothetical protein
VQAMYVRIPAEAHEPLVTVAEREFRHPRDQAAVLILEALRARGELPPSPRPAEGEVRNGGA